MKNILVPNENPRSKRYLLLLLVLIAMLLGGTTSAYAQVGTVWAWGYNKYGQLGDGTKTDKSAPLKTQNLTKIAQVTGGGYHSIALKSDGTVWAWGSNIFGQLGNGHKNDTHTDAIQVNGLTNVTQIAAGGNQSFALKSDGTLWAWGRKSLGDGVYDSIINPAQVSGLVNVVQVSGGGTHALALNSNGNIWAWGDNNTGQLGDGTNSDRSNPVRVFGIDKVVQTAGGFIHSLALKSDGTVWAWGSNKQGQLGDGGIVFYSNFPIQVSNLTNIVQIAGGGYYSLALKSDGTVWAWGANSSGQLGDGTNSDRSTPVLVTGLPNIVLIAASKEVQPGGGSHSIALKSDGTVWAWGMNDKGTLGDGTTISKNTPAQALNVIGQTCIAGGGVHGLSVQAVVQNTKTSASNLAFGYGKITLYAYLKDSSRGIFVINKPITFFIDGNIVGTAYTDASGKAALVVANSLDYGAGAHTYAATFAGDGLYNASNRSATLTITKAPTSVSIGTFSGSPGATKSLTATLKRKTDNAPLLGRTLTFSIDGNDIGTASTDGEGKASLSYKFDEVYRVGAHLLTAEYDGDGNHIVSFGKGVLNVLQAHTKLSVSSVSGKAGATVLLKAKWVRKTDGATLEGKTIRFQIDGTDIGSATTSAGVATLSFTIPTALSKGAHKITVLFDGDAFYLSVSDDTKILTVK